MGDELLQKFWEVEDCNFQSLPYSLEDRAVVNHFHVNHRPDEEGKFIVTLPGKFEVGPLGETRLMAVWKPLSGALITFKGKFLKFQ